MSASLGSGANGCFVCGPANPIGLKLQFEMQGEVCVATFTPGEHHIGFNSVVHGGLLFSVLDDVMANWLFLQGMRGYTAKASVRYRRHARVGEALALAGTCVSRRRRHVTLTGTATEISSGERVAETQGVFMLAEANPAADATA